MLELRIINYKGNEGHQDSIAMIPNFSNFGGHNASLVLSAYKGKLVIQVDFEN